MILIADSGSTKAQWVLADKGKVVHNMFTPGFNPYITSEEVIQSIIETIKGNVTAYSIDQIFFYGTGYSSNDKKKIIHELFQQYFPDAEIEIEHDLLGAARAACGKEEGIAVILGTGSSSCHFDGQNIIANVPAPGYVLGDEGGGSYIGKQLLKDFIYNELPADLYPKFTEKFQVTIPEIYEHVYQKPSPNRYLAEYAMFAQQYIDHPYCYNLVKNSFNDFFIHHVNKYPTNSEICINSIGSIGYFFKNILEETAHLHGKKLKNVYQSPADGLLKYHSNDQNH